SIPAYWLRPLQTLSSAAGMHRFVWDMHYAPVPGMKPYYPMTAVSRNTAPAPTSPWVVPGMYSVVLTVDGQRYTQPLTIAMDPRVKTSTADLQKQFELSMQVYDDLLVLQPVVDRAAATLTKLKSMREKASGPEAAKIDAAIQELQSLQGAGGRRRRGAQTEGLSGVRGSLMELLWVLQEVDAAPTMQATQAVSKVHQSATSLVQRWQEFASKQLAPLKVQP
ncbi:MAG: glycoside hydrolase, partial [Candidatus Korobacteraceae bacterium]